MQKNFNTNTDNNDVWLTPQWLVKSLGEFDLDPCSPLNRPWNTAKQHYTVHDNGLVLPWNGRVWLNPPYGNELHKWLFKMSQHLNGIALIFGRKSLIAYDHGKISKEEAIRRCLETNETKFESNQIKLAGLIKEIAQTYDLSDLVQTMPFSEEEINNYAALVDFSWEQYGTKKIDDDDNEEPKKFSITVHESEYDAFLADINDLATKYKTVKIT